MRANDGSQRDIPLFSCNEVCQAVWDNCREGLKVASSLGNNMMADCTDTVSATSKEYLALYGSVGQPRFPDSNASTTVEFDGGVVVADIPCDPLIRGNETISCETSRECATKFVAVERNKCELTCELPCPLPQVLF